MKEVTQRPMVVKIWNHYYKCYFFIPNLSTASADEINKCVMNYPSFNVVVDGVTKDSVADCLSKLNVPYSSQEMEYQLRQVELR